MRPEHHGALTAWLGKHASPGPARATTSSMPCGIVFHGDRDHERGRSPVPPSLTPDKPGGWAPSLHRPQIDVHPNRNRGCTTHPGHRSEDPGPGRKPPATRAARRASAHKEHAARRRGACRGLRLPPGREQSRDPPKRAPAALTSHRQSARIRRPERDDEQNRGQDQPPYHGRHANPPDCVNQRLPASVPTAIPRPPLPLAAGRGSSLLPNEFRPPHLGRMAPPIRPIRPNPEDRSAMAWVGTVWHAIPHGAAAAGAFGTSRAAEGGP